MGVAIATDATQAEGVYCEYLTKPYYAKIWVSLGKILHQFSVQVLIRCQLNIIHEVSLVLAVLTVVRFTFQLKSRLAQHNIVRKLVSLKVIVFLGFIQQVCQLSPIHVQNCSWQLLCVGKQSLNAAY